MKPYHEDDIASPSENLRSSEDFQGSGPPSTRNGLPQVLPPYGYSTPEMDAAISRYLASKAGK